MKIKFTDGHGNSFVKEENSKFLKKIGATRKEIKEGKWHFTYSRPNPEEKPNCKEGYVLAWHFVGNLEN